MRNPIPGNRLRPALWGWAAISVLLLGAMAAVQGFGSTASGPIPRADKKCSTRDSAILSDRERSFESAAHSGDRSFRFCPGEIG